MPEQSEEEEKEVKVVETVETSVKVSESNIEVINRTEKTGSGAIRNVSPNDDSNSGSLEIENSNAIYLIEQQLGDIESFVRDLKNEEKFVNEIDYVLKQSGSEMPYLSLVLSFCMAYIVSAMI